MKKNQPALGKSTIYSIILIYVALIIYFFDRLVHIHLFIILLKLTYIYFLFWASSCNNEINHIHGYKVTQHMVEITCVCFDTLYGQCGFLPISFFLIFGDLGPELQGLLKFKQDLS